MGYFAPFFTKLTHLLEKDGTNSVKLAISNTKRLKECAYIFFFDAIVVVYIFFA